MTYYLEAITNQGRTLSNKQMIKVPTGTIPNIEGLKDAINKKWNIDSVPDDSKIPQMYVQDVENNYVPDNNIPQSDSVVNNQYMQDGSTFEYDNKESSADGAAGSLQAKQPIRQTDTTLSVSVPQDGGIVNEDYNFGQKIYDLLGNIIYNIKSKFGMATETDRLEQARRKYRQALESVRKGNVGGNESFDIYRVNNKLRVVVETDITREPLNINSPKKLKKFIRNKYNEIKISLPDGTKGTTYVTDKGAGEYTYSEYTKNLVGKEKYDKYRMADNIDEILNAQENYKYENSKHKRKDYILGFYRSPIEVQVGNRLYSCELVTATTRGGTEEFYDVVNMVLKNKNEPHPTLSDYVSGRRGGNSFDSIVSQNETTVNNQYMPANENSDGSYMVETPESGAARYI